MWYLEMFYICNTQRNLGMDVGPIPQLDIVKIGEFYEVHDLYCFVYTMRCIDNEYMSFVRDLNAEKREKTPDAKFGQKK